MNHLRKKLTFINLLAALSVSPLTQAQPTIPYLTDLQDHGFTADPGAGKTLWYSNNDGRRCTSCHADSPSQTGKHHKTGKPIDPMALSVNPARYQKRRKIEKWFKRNCMWTLGRQCTDQEKVDVLSWLQTQ